MDGRSVAKTLKTAALLLCDNNKASLLIASMQAVQAAKIVVIILMPSSSLAPFHHFPVCHSASEQLTFKHRISITTSFVS